MGGATCRGGLRLAVAEEQNTAPPPAETRFAMAQVTYQIVEHDGGWAYKVGDVFSETFPTRSDAHAAAERAAAEQRAPDDDTVISYEDDKYRWHDETARGGDRPQTSVED